MTGSSLTPIFGEELTFDSVPCWYSRICAIGNQRDIDEFVSLLGVQRNMSFGYRILPPSPPTQNLVLGTLNENSNKVSVDIAWARENWGCYTDILDSTASVLSLRDNRQLVSITFFTYGGPPDLWVEQVALDLRESGPKVDLSFISYNETGDIAHYLAGKNSIYWTRTPRCVNEGIIVVEGKEGVRELLKEERFSYDPLVCGPHEDGVLRCEVDLKLFLKK